jgi:hypothetical protein
VSSNAATWTPAGDITGDPTILPGSTDHSRRMPPTVAGVSVVS